MKHFFDAGNLLLLDMESTLLFLVVYLLTRNIPLAVTISMGIGICAWPMCPRVRP